MTRQLAQPSPPPDSPRRFRLHRFQLIGVPIVFLLPVVLALAGLLGEGTATVRAESSSVVATIRYPSRLGYEQLGTMEVWVRNVTGAVIDTVTVAIDTAYANRFFQLMATPPLESSYTISLVGLAPGERRLANIEVQAEQYGIHAGEIRVIAGDTAVARLRTIMFP